LLENKGNPLEYLLAGKRNKKPNITVMLSQLFLLFWRWQSSRIIPAARGNYITALSGWCCSVVRIQFHPLESSFEALPDLQNPEEKKIN